MEEYESRRGTLSHDQGEKTYMKNEEKKQVPVLV